MLRSTCLLIACSTALLVAATPSTAQARKRRLQDDDHVVTIERWLLPRAIADRIQGSGIECRTRTSGGGAMHKTDVGALRLHLDDQISVRAGIGMAEHAPQALAAPRGGYAALAGVTYAFWQVDRYSLEVDVSALRAQAGDHGMLDGTVIVGFRGR